MLMNFLRNVEDFFLMSRNFSEYSYEILMGAMQSWNGFGYADLEKQNVAIIEFFSWLATLK